jgi:predicted kinase
MVITLVRGTSGAGKSSFVSSMIDDRATHLEADMYFMKDGEYNFQPSKLKDAHEWCKNYAEASMKCKENIVVSNTFTTEWEMKPYLDLAEKYGYTVFTVIVENRHGNKDIHDIPEETRQKQAERLSKSIKLI